MILRLVQLVSRYVAAFLVAVAAVLGADEEQAANFGVELGVWIGAVLGFFLDAAIHYLKSGGFLVPPGEKKKQGAALGSLPGMDTASRLVLLVPLAGPLMACVAAPNPLKAPAQRSIDMSDTVVRLAIIDDPTLSADQRAVRLGALDDFQAAVDAAPPEGRWVPYRWVPGGTIEAAE